MNSLQSIHIRLSLLAAALVTDGSGCGAKTKKPTTAMIIATTVMMEESAGVLLIAKDILATITRMPRKWRKSQRMPRAVTITATDFAFEPKTITAAPGEKLYVTLINKGQAVHMWQLDGLPETHLHTPVGETAAKTIVAPSQTGPYKVICSTPGHEQLGMIGQLEVRSDADAESGGLHPPMLTPSPDDSEHAHTHKLLNH